MRVARNKIAVALARKAAEWARRRDEGITSEADADRYFHGSYMMALEALEPKVTSDAVLQMEAIANRWAELRDAMWGKQP